MEMKYEQAMEEYNIQYSQLPEDAKTGIESIKEVLKALNMLEKKGKKPTAKAINKLKAMDKWVYYEILDMVNDTDKNEDEMPVDSDEVIEDIKEQANEQKQPELSADEKLGIEIEGELKKMLESGKKEWSIEEVKSAARKTYNVLFESYEEGDENGIRTSRYSLMETKPQVFTINKN